MTVMNEHEKKKKILTGLYNAISLYRYNDDDFAKCLMLSVDAFEYWDDKDLIKLTEKINGIAQKSESVSKVLSEISRPIYKKIDAENKNKTKILVPGNPDFVKGNG